VKTLLLAVGLLLGACAQEGAAAPPKPRDAPEGVPAAQINAPAFPVIDTSGPTSTFTQGRTTCTGHALQGGFVVCKTAPGALVTVKGGGSALKPESDQSVIADVSGYAVIGFDRDAKGAARIEAAGDGFTDTLDLPIAAREFSVQRVDGLPQDTVTPTDPKLLALIAKEVEKKSVGFASRAPVDAAFTQTWAWPTDGRISGLWGNQRVLNGVPKTPHYGVDIAGPENTVIRAPADGVVALAEPDMFFEGGLVFIDHGQGLISMYLHMNRVDVKAGDPIRQGDPVGLRGMRGRATGPHLCWRLKWRDRNLDPSLMPLHPVQPVAAPAPGKG
jgi:murein DD-endopeptidase MepM/ murein hydrolase activator NlpD